MVSCPDSIRPGCTTQLGRVHIPPGPLQPSGGNIKTLRLNECHCMSQASSSSAIILDAIYMGRSFHL